MALKQPFFKQNINSYFFLFILERNRTWFDLFKCFKGIMVNKLPVCVLCLLTCKNVTHWNKWFFQSSWPIALLLSWPDLSTRANVSASSEILSQVTYPCTFHILFIQLSALLLRKPINTALRLCQSIKAGVHVRIWLTWESQIILKIRQLSA